VNTVHTATAFLANIPSPDRGVWYLGPLPIRAYALCIIVGIAVAIWWGERRWAARGGTKGAITDIAVVTVLFGLIGGRLYHVITDYQLYFGPGKNPLDILKIYDGGLGIWGAIALGGVGAWIGCRRKGIPLPAVADAIAPGIVTAQAIGRIGNYFNQELFGGTTDLPWGLELYARVDPETGMSGVHVLNGVAQSDIPVAVVHPTFLYELIWNLLVAGLVVWADRRFELGHGRAFAVYVAGYTVGRFWIELLRADEANHILGLRVNSWTSMVVFVGAVVFLLLARRRGPREAPETLRDREDPRREAEDGSTGGGTGDEAQHSDPLGSTDPSDSPESPEGTSSASGEADSENGAPRSDGSV